MKPPRPLCLRFGVALVAASFLLSGCAQSYTLRLSNGTSIYSRTRPKLERGYYLYQDADGREQKINELRVREIEAN